MNLFNKKPDKFEIAADLWRSTAERLVPDKSYDVETVINVANAVADGYLNYVNGMYHFS